MMSRRWLSGALRQGRGGLGFCQIDSFHVRWFPLTHCSYSSRRSVTVTRSGGEGRLEAHLKKVQDGFCHDKRPEQPRRNPAPPEHYLLLTNSTRTHKTREISFQRPIEMSINAGGYGQPDHKHIDSLPLTHSMIIIGGYFATDALLILPKTDELFTVRQENTQA